MRCAYMGTCTLDNVQDFLSEVAMQPHASSGNKYIFAISVQFFISFLKQKLAELALWDKPNIECQSVRRDMFLAYNSLHNLGGQK